MKGWGKIDAIQSEVSFAWDGARKVPASKSAIRVQVYFSALALMFFLLLRSFVCTYNTNFVAHVKTALFIGFHWAAMRL
jgi:hypothetical protein